MELKIDKIIAETDFEFNLLLNPGAADAAAVPFMNLWLPHPAPAYNENSDDSNVLLYQNPDFKNWAWDEN